VEIDDISVACIKLDAFMYYTNFIRNFEQHREHGEAME
jgi:hypothetical protein